MVPFGRAAKADPTPRAILRRAANGFAALIAHQYGTSFVMTGSGVRIPLAAPAINPDKSGPCGHFGRSPPREFLPTRTISRTAAEAWIPISYSDLLAGMPPNSQEEVGSSILPGSSRRRRLSTCAFLGRDLKISTLTAIATETCLSALPRSCSHLGPGGANGPVPIGAFLRNSQLSRWLGHRRREWVF